MKNGMLRRLIPVLVVVLLAAVLCPAVMATSVPENVCKTCVENGEDGTLHATTEYKKVSQTQHAQYYECAKGHKMLRYDEDGGFLDLFDHVASREATCKAAALCGDCGEEFGAPLEHEAVVDPEVPATCAQTGLTAGSHCKNCGEILIAQEEIEKLDHEFDDGKKVEPTCVKKGGMLYVCKNCGAKLLTEEVDALAHWYDEWVPAGDGKMSAPCKRAGCNYIKTTDCIEWKLKLLSGEEKEATEYSVCPVCGETSDGTRLEMLKGVSVWTYTGWTPKGDLTIRVGDLENGEKLMSVCFEFDARLMQHIGRADYTVPAEALEGYRLMLLDEDGNETELEVTVKDDKATFTLDFTAPWQELTPARVLHLIPIEPEA